MNYYRSPFTLLLALACGCTPSNIGTPAPKASDATVKTDVPTMKPMRRVIEQPATIEGFQETALLVAHISGYVKKVDADIGKLVEPDDILAEIAVPEMLQELKQKEALVKQASAEVDQATATLTAAEANILSMQALVTEAKAARARAAANYERWKSEYARVEKLVSDKVVDAQIGAETLNQFKAADAIRQEVEAKVESAQAMTKESQAKRDKAKADVAASQARVLVAQAEEGRFKALADYRFIRAPFKGVVTRRFIHPGALLQPNASGGPVPMFFIARTDKVRIIAEIPENEAKYFLEDLPSKIGLAAKIQIPALKDQIFSGHVARTSDTLDPKTRTLRIEIDYVNKNKELRSGMFATLIFELEFVGRTTLPASAIFIHADQPCCWRVVNGKAVRTPVKLGLHDGQLVEVLKMKTPESNWESVTGSEEVIITNLGAVSESKEVKTERK